MNGFINYYGHQRFGNHASVPTHQIGLFLVQGNFKEACEMILKPRDNDTPDMQRVREHWWENRQAKEALALLQRHDRGGRSIESKLLAGLTKNGPNDYVNSLEQVRIRRISVDILLNVTLTKWLLCMCRFRFHETYA